MNVLNSEKLVYKLTIIKKNVYIIYRKGSSVLDRIVDFIHSNKWSHKEIQKTRAMNDKINEKKSPFFIIMIKLFYS